MLVWEVVTQGQGLRITKCYPSVVHCSSRHTVRGVVCRVCPAANTGLCACACIFLGGGCSGFTPRPGDAVLVAPLKRRSLKRTLGWG